MILLELVRTVRMGVKSLLLHKLRAFLTMLGMLFGVASVVAMLAVGEGASKAAQDRIQALGSTNILLRSKKPDVQEQNTSSNVWTAQVYGLTYDDLDRFKHTLPAAELVVPVRETHKEMRVGAEYQASYVLGTTPEYLTVTGMRVREGRWLTDQDDQRRTNVCVLGAFAAENLFPLDNPIGQSVRAGSDRFTVVGVLETLGRASGSVGPPVDECVFVPMSVSRAWFGDTSMKRTGGSMEVESVQLHEIKIRVADPAAVLDTARVVREMLSENHAKQDFTVVVPLELLKEAEAQKLIWNLVLGSIAGISLLVGGIGIMNVMLATVTERTREIGIRRALGAKKKHIVSQFLVETVVLSMTGGLLGVAAGLAGPILIETFAKMPTVALPQHWILSFGVSALVGVVSGLYPAVRAANMDPVEALRHE
ncbi:MAG: ABC transporter permease [Planctomycetes bacterium]|nr:ABC transporter permease [Planctomycetota bacterium]